VEADVERPGIQGSADEDPETCRYQGAVGGGCHWGRGHLEMDQNISGTLKGEAQFT